MGVDGELERELRETADSVDGDFGESIVSKRANNDQGNDIIEVSRVQTHAQGTPVTIAEARNETWAYDAGLEILRNISLTTTEHGLPAFDKLPVFELVPDTFSHVTGMEIIFMTTLVLALLMCYYVDDIGEVDVPRFSYTSFKLHCKVSVLSKFALRSASSAGSSSLISAFSPDDA